MLALASLQLDQLRSALVALAVAAGTVLVRRDAAAEEVAFEVAVVALTWALAGALGTHRRLVLALREQTRSLELAQEEAARRAGAGVLLVDDQALVRGGLRLCLDPEPDLEIVGEASDGREAVETAGRLRPDVVLMDVRMPVMDGIEATRRIVQLTPQPAPRVIVLTTFDLDEHVYAALAAGASGFLLKDIAPDSLPGAVRLVAQGDALLAPSVTRRLISRFARRPPPDPSARLQELTPREADVLQLVARGL
ncbi:MAG: response regulator transcription factor, partial [Candidatus Dormibacteraeota bacterium]|nr:response regulator transcription factor [Candidatus Dormibacteraeota bacterium]